MSATSVVVMGVCGCGKTSLGSALAARLGIIFLEGDDFHPPENVAKMRAGLALDDADRAPWLASLAAQLKQHEVVVIACSALKKRYREVLSASCPTLRFVYLHGHREIIAERLAQRRGHYMPASLLDSQLAVLEEPGSDENHFTVDLNQPPEQLLEAVLDNLRSEFSG